MRIAATWHAHRRDYGAHKVGKQLQRDGSPVAGCNVERPMQRLGGQGVVRGARLNPLRVADFTYVATWRGFVYVA